MKKINTIFNRCFMVLFIIAYPINNVYAQDCVGGTLTEYRVSTTATLAQNTIATNGGVLNLVFQRYSGSAIPGVSDTFTIPVQYSGMNNTTGTGALNQWQSLAEGAGSVEGYVMILPNTSDTSGGIYHNLPTQNRTTLIPNVNTINTDTAFNHYLGIGSIQKLGNFNITFGDFPNSFPSGVTVAQEILQVRQSGNMIAANTVAPPYNLRYVSGYLLKPDLQTDLQTDNSASTNAFIVQPGQTYTYWYSAFRGNGETMAVNGGVRGSGIYGSLTLCYTPCNAGTEQVPLTGSTLSN